MSEVVRILISPPLRRELQILLSHRKKIEAIKLLRGQGRYQDPDRRAQLRLTAGANIGLVDAKKAVEKLAGADHRDIALSGSIDVKEIHIDTPTGVLVVDMEGLQLHGLMHLRDGAMGLETCGAVLDLVDAIQAWRQKWSIGPPQCDQNDVGDTPDDGTC